MERSGWLSGQLAGWLQGGQHFGELNAGRRRGGDDHRQLAISIKQVGRVGRSPGIGEKMSDRSKNHLVGGGGRYLMLNSRNSAQIHMGHPVRGNGTGQKPRLRRRRRRS